jgi:uncharacterized protein YqgC (DUF456 family)
MELLYILLGSLLLIVGIIGCFVPVIPGPIIGYLALLGLEFIGLAMGVWSPRSDRFYSGQYHSGLCHQTLWRV